MTRRPRSRLRRRLLALGVASASLAVFSLVALLEVVPWLGRSGNLNAIIEQFLSSSLTVPIRIGHIESKPLSQLTVTRLRSIEVHAEDRLDFSSEELSIFYSPLDLFSGRIQRFELRNPAIFVNLDANLSGLARLPDIPSGRESEEAPLPAGDAVLPFTVETMAVEGGEVTLQLEGRRIGFSNLHLEVLELGKSRGQSFKLSVDAFGGKVEASGALDVLTLAPAGRAPRYAVRSARVEIENLRLADLLAWILGGEAPAAAGIVSLSGSLDGTWPERLEVELAGRAAGITSGPGAATAVEDGALEVKLGATVWGQLEKVAFNLSSRAQATLGGALDRRAQGGSLSLRGEFHRQGGEDALVLAPLKLQIEDAAELQVSGKVRSLLAGASPALELDVDLPPAAMSKLRRHLPGSILPPAAMALAERLDATLALKLHVAGTLAEPLIQGSFEAHDARYTPESAGPWPLLQVAGSFAGLRLETQGGALRLDSIVIETEAAGGSFERQGVTADGLWRLRLQAADLSYPPDAAPIKVRAYLEWSSGAVELAGSPGGGATAVESEVTLEAELLPRERRGDLVGIEASARLKDLLVGSFYANLDGKPLELEGTASAFWEERGALACLEVAGLEARAPVLGPVAISFQASRGGAGFEVRGDLEAPEVRAAEAFRYLVREPLRFSHPFLEESRLEGGAALSLGARGDLSCPSLAGRFRLTDGNLVLQRLSAEGIELDLPFEVGPRLDFGGPASPLPGILRARRLALGPLEVAELDLPFQFDGGKYRLSEPRRHQILGGTVELAEAEVWRAGELSTRLTLHARNLDLEELTKAHGLPVFAGRMDLDLAPLVARGSELQALGTLTISAFGGRLTLSDLRLENFLEPYSNFSLREGDIEDVSLAEVGEVFHFGAMSGILRGEVKNLAFTGGELTSFDIDAETVPRPGVPQFINFRAVRSLQSVLAGPFSVIEEKFLSRFRYARFGFRAQLENDIFRLRGKYRFDGVEYLMYGHWYQFPRISIINSLPDHAYDWPRIVGHLREIYEKGATESD